MAVERADRVLRFGVTERRLHMIHATAFFAMFASGVILYQPSLAQMFSDRPLFKAIHLTAAVAWLTALALVVVLGDRRALRRTRRELERLDADDLLWLRNRGRGAPQGRFNAGQKLHSVFQAALALLFTVSGTLLLLGERNTTFRLPGTIALHDVATLVAFVLVVGHIWMALSPSKLPSVEGILRGTVPVAWAAEQHPKWVQRGSAAGVAPGVAVRPGVARLATAAAVVAVGVTILATLVFT
jgi:formate dehydrogenase subunit gamma